MTSNVKKAKLYRMVTDQHICPFGIKSKDLLQRKGYVVEDNHLTTREETDAFKANHDVKTTPQTFIEETRIGGYDDLRQYFGLVQLPKSGTTYTPVIAIFAMTFLMAIALSLHLHVASFVYYTFMKFIAFSMCVLAILKLRDLYAFTNQFITYDLLSQRWLPYAYIYPFAEAAVGVGMIWGGLEWLFALIALFIGSIGAVSVYKAVYIDKRELKCACVGGNSNVPLGFVSLSENLMMIIAALIMLML